MSIYRRGVAPVDVRLGDRNVTRIYLGDRLVYDGTVPVFANLPRARSASTAPPGMVVIPATVDLPTALAGSLGPAGTAEGGAGVDQPPALAHSFAPAGEVLTGATIDLPAALAASIAPPGSVGSTIVDLSTALAQSTAPPGLVGAGVTVDLPAALAGSLASAGGIRAGVGVALSPALATSLAPAGAVATFKPSRMTKSGATANFPTGASQITGWAPDTVTAPGSTVTDNDLVIQTSAGGVTIEASIEFTNSSFLARTITLRILLNGTVIATSSAISVPVSGGVVTVPLSITGQTVTAGSAVRVTAQPSTANSVSATNNAASYVRVYRP